MLASKRFNPERIHIRLLKGLLHEDRKVFITSGTSGGLVLIMLSMIDPGDEVIIFDPYFVMYPPLIELVGGVPVVIDTYPNFRIDIQKVAAAITSKTKMVLFNSPANPTGVMASPEEMKALAMLCQEKNVALISDELYSLFTFDGPMRSPAEFNRNTIVLDGFSKTHALTGWRVGFAHGPSSIIQTMLKVQQYSFVCSPQPAQWGALAALDYDMSQHRADYRSKRDHIVEGLKNYYEFESPGGAFYIFPKAPWGTATEFVHHAIENELLIIPGNIFSKRDTHFRISFAASEAMLDRGIEVLRRIAKKPNGK
jgi:aspartate/methionine/tyrosine aminotransferase